MAKKEKYTITCTKEQLKMISLAVEDWHRFLAGQCEMSNAMKYLMRNGNTRKIEEILSQQVKPIVTPYLPFNASYSWDGALCPNIDQRKAIAMSYGIYRQIELCRETKTTGMSIALLRLLARNKEDLSK